MAKHSKKKVVPKYDRIVVVGCGGIWSYLWQVLGRMVTYSPGAPKKLILVDKDYFTPGNLERQDATIEDIRQRKVEVYAARIKKQFPRIKVRVVAEFLSSKNIGTIIRPRTLVVSCLDNFPTRKEIAEFVKNNSKRLKNTAVLQGANETLSGNVHLHLIEGGKPLTKGMDDCHPEIKNTKQKNPADMNCEELARLPSGGQLAVANMMTASIMASYLWFLMGGKPEERKDPKKVLVPQSETFYSLDRFVMEATSRAVPANSK